MGYLYQPKLKSGGTGSIYWCKYYVNGRAVREGTGCEKEKEGRAFLKRREGAVANGAPIMPRADRITYDELAADLRRHYTTTGARDLREAEKRLRHLDRFFTGARAVTITPARVTEYVETRQKATRRPDGTEKPGASNGSINRELSVLGAMLRRGYKNNKVLRLPMIEKLEEAAPRAGFFEDHQYEAVRWRLPEDLQAATALMYTYGWRVGEVLSRGWRHVDLQAGTLRLDPGETKNGDGRVVYLSDELNALLTAQRARVEALQRQLGRIIPWVFPHVVCGRRYQAGDRREDYRKAWVTACTDAGVPDRLRHDFRRTAVRNMERRTVARSVAMKVTGHRTEAVYRRYAIVSDADLREATRRLTGTFSGTFAPSVVESCTATVRPSEQMAV